MKRNNHYFIKKNRSLKKKCKKIFTKKEYNLELKFRNNQKNTQLSCSKVPVSKKQSCILQKMELYG